jgi:hypothetical protein
MTRAAHEQGNRFMRRGVVLAKAHAQLVVCSSEATKSDCIAAGFEEDRLRVVLLGSDEQPRARRNRGDQERAATQTPVRRVGRDGRAAQNLPVGRGVRARGGG